MKYILSVGLAACAAIALYFIAFQGEVDAPENSASALRSKPSGRILQYGIYERVRGGRIVDSEKTTTGKAVSGVTIQQVEQTERVPAEKDVYFSYQYRLSGIESNSGAKNGVINLKRVLTHPPIILPDGRTKTGSEYMIRGTVKRGEVFAFDGYAFNESYELVEGPWVFQIWYKGTKLVEQTFISYMPGKAAGDQS
ncbi:hypothetical protein MNBD_GAMMA11-1589 [hydrothermal vent metagenome]|uniref:DUF3859 domain-containing protein n=1 Tax=hydrothermal vent metagenome TaxID=652676 RepID=A0A3B0XPM6_9ZZZZ